MNGWVTGQERAVLGVERSACGNRWVDRLSGSGHQMALALAQRLAIPDMLARILAGRGVDLDSAEDFLAPSLRRLLPDPSSLVDMDRAAERLAAAIRRGEKVAIFGDYDVDGATSAALLARFLKANGLDPLIHIPDRVTEGYGPSEAAVSQLAQAGATLLVTVDCGSTGHRPLRHATALCLDVVVLDHHQIGAELPPAIVVNPNRQDDLSAQGHLAAVGVVFLTLVAVNRLLKRDGWYCTGRIAPDLLAWLDLVALGTVADVVPLVGLNRAYVTKGLIALRRRASIGLAALGDAARLVGPVECYHLGFVLGPRINAGGRIGDASLGVRLLLCEEEGEAARLAAELDRLNGERQEIERVILEEALAGVEAEGVEGKAVVVAHSDADWHPGVVGLVAARLKERFDRPAFAISFDAGGTGTGSGRSVPGADLGSVVRAAVEAGLAEKGGGHAMAAGVTIRRTKLEAFANFLDAALADAVAARQSGQLAIDASLSASGATPDLVRQLETAGPYGAGNPEPVVAVPGHRLVFLETTAQGHMRCRLQSPDGSRMDAVAFRCADAPLGAALQAARGEVIHAAGTLRIDSWGGCDRVQLHLKDAARPA